MTTAAVILAAGYGTRMKSALPKVLHPLLGRTMIEWAVDAVQPVVDLAARRRGRARQGRGPGCARRSRALCRTGTTAWHRPRRAAGRWPSCRDRPMPCSSPMAIRPCCAAKPWPHWWRSIRQQQPVCNPAIALLTVTRDDPQGFGRIVRDATRRRRAGLSKRSTVRPSRRRSVS